MRGYKHTFRINSENPIAKYIAKTAINVSGIDYRRTLRAKKSGEASPGPGRSPIF